MFKYLDKFSKQLSSTIALGDFVSDGYSQSDLQGYYSGVYCMVFNETAQAYIPVLVRELAANNGELVAKVHFLKDADPDDYRYGVRCSIGTVPASDLKRFIPINGFVLQPGSLQPYTLSYGCDKTYKKSCNASSLTIVNLKTQQGTRENTRVLYALTAYMYPARTDGVSTVYSSRLCSYKGTLYTLHGMYTIGTVKDGVTSTPFECVSERMNQLNQSQDTNYLGDHHA